MQKRKEGFEYVRFADPLNFVLRPSRFKEMQRCGDYEEIQRCSDRMAKN